MTPKFVPLTTEQSGLLIGLLLDEMHEGPFQWADEMPFLSAIIDKRIKVMNLPITFTPRALLAVYAFCDRPGLAVLLLIDALRKFEGQTVTVSKLCELYPVGFYDEDSMGHIIDNEMKTRTGKWSEVY